MFSSARSANVIAAVAVVVALATGIVNHLDAKAMDETARRATEAQIEALRTEGRVYSVTGRLAIYRVGSGVWEMVPERRNVTSAAAGGDNVVLEVTVTNSGLAKGSVEKVGVATGGGSFTFAEAVNCEARDNTIEPCRMPVELDPPISRRFYIDINKGSVRKALTCNAYSRSGIDVAIGTGGGGVITQRIPQSVYYTNDCAELS